VEERELEAAPVVYIGAGGRHSRPIKQSSDEKVAKEKSMGRCIVELEKTHREGSVVCVGSV